MGRFFPKYTWIEWSLLGLMAATLVMVPMLLPDSPAPHWLTSLIGFPPGSTSTVIEPIRFEAIAYLFLGLMGNAWLWQEPRFMHQGYGTWLGMLIGGPILSLVAYFSGGWLDLVDVGLLFVYAALWSMLRVFLRRKFLNSGGQATVVADPR